MHRCTDAPLVAVLICTSVPICTVCRGLTEYTVLSGGRRRLVPDAGAAGRVPGAQLDRGHVARQPDPDGAAVRAAGRLPQPHLLLHLLPGHHGRRRRGGRR